MRRVGVALLLASLIGLLSGTLSALFLYLLDTATRTRDHHPWLLFLLPFAGFLVGWLYHRYGRDLESGNNLIIDEISKPKSILRFRLAPLVLFGTLATHLFGGSAGREGTAVQMGGAAAELIGKWQGKYRLTTFLDRKSLLICGVAAGFASVFGTPVAGAIFAFELLAYRHLRARDLMPCAFAAFIGHFVSYHLGTHHTDYRSLLASNPNVSLDLLRASLALVSGLAFGLVARLFSESVHGVSRVYKRIQYSPLRALVGGGVVGLVVLVFHLERYQGLGLPVLVAAFDGPIRQTDFILKLILTALTLGAGFKGGEVTPLFFIGATFGHTLATWLPLPPPLLACMGFVAVFAGAANVPIASIAMGVELFGWKSLPLLCVACFASYAVSGRRGIYRAQRPDSFRFKLF